LIQKKHKLEYTEKFDFLLLGLVSTENDYRLIWTINNALNFAFEKTDNHVVLGKDDKAELEFSYYTFDNEDTFLYYRLLSNRTESGILMEELKNIDYLLIIQGDISESYIKGLISDLKNVEQIQGVFRISPGSLKNRERLIF
jgi:hypothetical protein